MELTLRKIRKAFGGVVANDGIDLGITAGSIKGILGENGAGKSTLMKILSGYYQADSGDILIDGAFARIRSPADALARGIGMLHQDPLDFAAFTVIDNFLAGSPRPFFLDRRSAVRSLVSIASRFGFDLDATRPTAELSVGERQQLEIVRLLSMGARTLILDEPTTGISHAQKEALFSALVACRGEGMAILFVSHKLEDVERLCDGVCVLRKGRSVGEREPPFDTRDLVELMFGRDLPMDTKRVSIPPGKPVLSLEHASFENQRTPLEGVDFEIREGEIVGLAGMEGSGQLLMLEACAGLVRPIHGTILVHGPDGARSGNRYPDFRSAGVSFIPAARLERGLVPGLSVAEHHSLVAPERGFFIDEKTDVERARRAISRFDIRGEPDTPVQLLSGGNQQRMLLSLVGDARRLILIEHPTRGLDMESAAFIWRTLVERCTTGTAVMFCSSDLDEIIGYSDRVFVFFTGTMSGPFEAASLSVTELGRRIGGKADIRGKAEATHANA